ncbi:MAG: GDP-mannose 4,6-dehydratase [Candidatus Omnitrophica bacterium]|jgi:GDPmannose 4,6-dehydratase|nr:GDP-mannose 4,6-dehydratase [Candidatus Omnitrophota bacterium]
MKTALITGIAGQDGSYLTEFLLAKGYKVIGIEQNRDNIPDYFSSSLINKVDLLQLDIVNYSGIKEVFLRYKPDEVYNYAAYSSGSGMFDNPAKIAEVNGLAVVHMLEIIRQAKISSRFCQASSSEMFGGTTGSPQSEKTPFNPRSPYGAAKLYAHSMVGIYRKHYGLFASSAILFNHESPRRGLGFVTKKIVHEAVRIKLGLAGELHLGNLDARRDWGFAGDYVQAMWLMLQQPEASDYVVATGQTHSVREICEIVFGYLNLDYKSYVRNDPAEYRMFEEAQLVGDWTKARTQLGWSPKVGFREMITLMVDAEMEMKSV